jgi:hypothetical protein
MGATRSPSSSRRSGVTSALGRRTVLLIVAGALCTSLAAVSLWTWRTFASSQGFADVATDMLKEPAVREMVAGQIVTALESQPDMMQVAVTARPVLESMVTEVVGTTAFQGIFHAGVRELHSDVIAGHRSRMLVKVDDSVQLVKDGLRVVNPTVADAVPDSALEVAVGVSQSAPADQLLRLAELSGWLVGPIALIGLGCFVLAVWTSTDRRRAVETIGWTLVGLGILGFAVLAVGVNIASSFGSDPRQRTAFRAIFWSFTHLINVECKVGITVGAVVAVAAAYAGTGAIRARFEDLCRAVWSQLERPVWRMIASLVLIGGAVFALTFPAASAAMAMRVLGFVALVAGAVLLLDLVGSRDWTTEGSDLVRHAARRTALALTGTTTACVLILTFGGLGFVRAVRAPRAAHASMAETGCNGAVELCDRRVDEVTFAGTHNSMAASRSHGWTLNRHVGGISAQLAAGVRALLVDLHYGQKVGELVRTDFRSESEERLAKSDVTPEGRIATENLLGLVGAAPPPGDRRVYLCHLYCELGATPAESAFRLIADFLRENPNEVVVLMLEDHVDAKDGIRALEHSGLAKRALSWTPGEPLPTLGQMIRERRNLLVLVEYQGGAAPWYIPTFTGAVQDTPYDFASEKDFSCAPNRGTADAPLLLVNHWLDTGLPDVKATAAANAADVLGARARSCAIERHHQVNVLAVDFYSEGDLMEVVRELNGLGDPKT